MRAAAVLACALSSAVALVGCSADIGASAESVENRTSEFPGTGSFDYQLGGAYEPSAGLDTVVRDSTAEPVPGAYSICYVNGFQTQPGSEWNPNLLLADSTGTPVVDPQWPDENILDPGTAEQRAGILAVVGPIVDACAAKGFAAVEIDNLDIWTRFPDRMDEDSVVALARLYADRAHASGMEIAQKNAPDEADRLRADVGFDFAVAEECVAYDECGSYAEAYGSRVFDIEYTDNLPASFEQVCARQDRPAVTVLRDRALVPPTDQEYAYQQC